MRPVRLPQLTGRWLAAFRALWIVAFLLAIVGTAWNATAAVERNRVFNLAVYQAGVRALTHDGRRYLAPLSSAVPVPGLVADLSARIARLEARPA